VAGKKEDMFVFCRGVLEEESEALDERLEGDD
jgi:hypothetical protein